jgi:hypothetical protein
MVVAADDIITVLKGAVKGNNIQLRLTTALRIVATRATGCSPQK